MENPIEAFGKLNDKQKMLVVGGAAGVGALLYFHSKKQADPGGTQDATPTQDTSYTDQGGAFGADTSGGGYGGGYAGGYSAPPPSAPVTSANDGTTPEAPIVNVAAPDLSGIADAISSLAPGDTGGGPPVTDPGKHAAPKKASSFKTITKVNKKTGTTQTIHDYAGSHPDVVVSSHKTTVHKAPAKHPVAKKPAKKHANHK